VRAAALVSVAIIASAFVANATEAQPLASAPHGLIDPLPRTGELHPCATAVEWCEGELRVPLDWDDPGSEQITVAFVWLPRRDTTRPAAGTILGNFGGPDAAIPMVPVLQRVLGPVLDRQNLLVVDPRGLGQSDPLECPGLDMTDPETVAACADELGPRIRHYSTAQVVRDMDAVRDALGVPQISFYGNSYGTVFAQAYAIRFPHRTAAVYLDSLVPLDEDGWVAEAYGRSTEAIELICGRSSACATVSDSPSATVERLIETLRVKPDPSVPIGGLRFLLVGVNVVGTREVVAAAAAYLEGDAAPLHRLSAGLGGGERITVPGDAGTLAITCADARFPFERDAPPGERRRQLDRFYHAQRAFAPFRRSELFEGFVNWVEDCLHWPTPGESRPVPSGVTGPTVPVFAAASDFDTWSPGQVAEALGRFPSSTLLRVRFGGHALAMGPWNYSECVRMRMRAFLADPEDLPQAPTPDDPDGCDGENYRAVGSFPRTMGQTPPAEGQGLDEPERHLVAATFATVADAVARRNPLDRVRRAPAEQGLRGGHTRWDADARTIKLEEVRFVEDLVVSGTIQIDPEHDVTAEVLAAGSDGTVRELTLRWRAFLPEDDTLVDGFINGRRYTARVPLH
jgi:pimeloyl-ACP methyl ester carboxylesterase